MNVVWATTPRYLEMIDDIIFEITTASAFTIVGIFIGALVAGGPAGLTAGGIGGIICWWFTLMVCCPE